MNIQAASPAANGAFMPTSPARAPETELIGLSDAPFVTMEPGFELQLLHVDLKQGLWILRTRWAPGMRLARHYHSGPVYAVTVQGRWFYEETPKQMNESGAYLFEPAGSIHTLCVPADQVEPTIAWFAIWGPNLNLSADNRVETIVDAASILELYRSSCVAAGLSSDHLIVVR